MRVRSAASQSMPAALALARQLRVTPREALALLREPRLLPAELERAEAEQLCAALRAQGVAAEPVEVPLTSRRCELHPALTGEAPCEDCRALACPLCLPRCPRCAKRHATRTRLRHARIVLLLLVLLAVVTGVAMRQGRLEARTEWRRTLRVSVVLVSPKPVEPAVREAWSQGLAELDAWFAAEAARLGLPLEQPMHFELAPVAVQATVPPVPDVSGEFLRDSEQALGFRTTLESLVEQGGAAGRFDVRLVVALRTDGGHRVEGIGEAGGNIGLVEGTAGDTSLTLELVAVAHELLHCLGAQDGYDAAGHAQPRGIVEPARGWPQRFAEVMVGEVPLAPGAGRVPKALDEVRLGEVTAREVGWLPPR